MPIWLQIIVGGTLGLAIVIVPYWLWWNWSERRKHREWYQEFLRMALERERERSEMYAKHFIALVSEVQKAKEREEQAP